MGVKEWSRSRHVSPSCLFLIIFLVLILAFFKLITFLPFSVFVVLLLLFGIIVAILIMTILSSTRCCLCVCDSAPSSSKGTACVTLVSSDQHSRGSYSLSELFQVLLYIEDSYGPVHLSVYLECLGVEEHLHVDKVLQHLLHVPHPPLLKTLTTLFQVSRLFGCFCGGLA